MGRIDLSKLDDESQAVLRAAFASGERVEFVEDGGRVAGALVPAPDADAVVEEPEGEELDALLAEGLRQADAGETRSWAEVRKELGERYGF